MIQCYARCAGHIWPTRAAQAEARAADATRDYNRDMQAHVEEATVGIAGVAGAVTAPPAPAPAAKPFSLPTVITIALGHLVHDAFTSFLSPLLPLIIPKLGLSLTLAGSLAAFQQFPSLINPLLGMLGDRFSLRWLAILAPSVTGVAACLLGVAPTYGALAILLLTAGIGTAMWHVPTPVMVARASGSRVGFGMSLLMLGGELSRAIGPLVAVAAASLWGLEGMWQLIPVGVAASIVLYWRTRNLDVKPAAHVGGAWADAWRELRQVMLPIAGIIATRTFLSVSLATYLPTLLTQEGSSLIEAGGALSILMLAGATGSFATGTLSDRFGRRRVMGAVLTCAPLMMAVFLSVQGWLMAPVLFAVGFLALSTSPVMMALVQEYGRSKPATANGLYMAMEFVGGSLITVLVGALADAVGLRAAFAISAGLALCAVPFVLLLPRPKSTVPRHP